MGPNLKPHFHYDIEKLPVISSAFIFYFFILAHKFYNCFK